MTAYLPLLVALSFHTHELPQSAADGCPDCANHLTHKAHLYEAAVSAHDCGDCQLTTASYYEPGPIVLAEAEGAATRVVVARGCEVVSRPDVMLRLRAPPTV